MPGIQPPDIGEIRDGLLKKSRCSFGFCPNYLDPPLPLIWTTCTTFLNANVPKNLGKGLPLPPHSQIDPIYTICEKWTKNLGRALPPPSFGQNPKEQLFFSGVRPLESVDVDVDAHSFNFLIFEVT